MALPLCQRINVSRRSMWFQAATCGVSAALCLAAALVFWIQPDAFAAVLVLPRWLWIFPGIAIALIGFTRQRQRFVLAAIGLWFLYAIFFMQEWRSVFRFGTASVQAASADGKMVRVISLNCSAGDENAAAEVGKFNPDIALFQETPLRPIVQRLAPQILGADAQVLSGSDVSLIAHGKLTPITPGNAQSAPFGHARIELPSGLVVEVFTIRLHPYGIRADLWSPDCWREQRENRIHQREQFRWLAREVEKAPANVPIILGGDFNLPAGDKLFRILDGRLHDTFLRAGHGWGDTLANDFPFIRIDQIWCDAHFRPVSTVVRKTANSDHRMVVCDLIIAGK